MLAFYSSLLPYLILCSVLMVAKKLKHPTVFDFKFKRRPSQKVLLSKLPSTDSLSNSPAPSSPGEVFKIMHRSLRYHIDPMYHCISRDQQTHLIFDHLTSHADHARSLQYSLLSLLIMIMNCDLWSHMVRRRIPPVHVARLWTRVWRTCSSFVWSTHGSH